MRHEESPSHALFRVVAEGHYRLSFPDHGIEFVADRLRRERHELYCELAVSCGIAGARAVDGVLSVGTFNLSSPSAASQRARLLAERARARGLDWQSLLEELRQRVLAAERDGGPSMALRDVPPIPPSADEFQLLGLSFPKHHPTIVFGDGGTGKSLLALRIASELATDGARVGYFDWELDAFTHRRRFEQINGRSMPEHVRYVRLDKPLVHDVDRLRRIVLGDELTFAVLDSIAYGTNGAPESAEAAMEYCRALRQLGIGTLLLAHITKAENGDQRPFGSTFWFNSARSVWNLKLATTSSDGDTLHLAAFHRKSNLGRLRPPVGLRIDFEADRVHFTNVDATSIDEVASALPLWQRIKAVVSSGPQTLAAIAGELNVEKVDTLDRVVRRHKELFIKLPGTDGITRVALVDRRAS